MEFAQILVEKHNIYHCKSLTLYYNFRILLMVKWSASLIINESASVQIQLHPIILCEPSFLICSVTIKASQMKLGL